MNFKTMREKTGLKQEDAAKIFGVSRTAVAKWETGKSLPRAELLPLIAQTYHCEISELLQNTTQAG